MRRRSAALWLDRFAFMEKAGARWWPIAGGIYVVRAIKRIHGMRLVTPAWRQERARRRALAPIPQKTQGLAQEPAMADEMVEIFSDGACRGNPGPGGWGALLRFNHQEKELWGGEAETTNNRMELTAVIRALEALKRPSRVRLYTDSQYVQKGISQWIHGWKRRGWRTADKKPVKNADLWLSSTRWPPGTTSSGTGSRATRAMSRTSGRTGLPTRGSRLLRQIVLDTETTGLNPKLGDRIIEIGCVEILSRAISERQFHAYVDPERDIEEGASRVHGLTREDLRAKPKFADIAAQFLDYVRGAELLIHNADFDVEFLDMELGRLGLGRLAAHVAKVTDTLAFARELHPGRKNSLDALCERYFVNNANRTLHGALLDARLLAECWLAMTRGQESLVMELESPTRPRRRWRWRWMSPI